MTVILGALVHDDAEKRKDKQIEARRLDDLGLLSSHWLRDLWRKDGRS